MPVESNLLKGYHAAVDLAVGRLSASDPVVIARRSQSTYDADRTQLRLMYLGHTYTIDCPLGRVCKEGTDEDAPVTTLVLLLNYILSAHRQMPTGEYIAYRDIPGAATYEPSFLKRSVTPLVKTFGSDPTLLCAAGEMFDAEEAAVGDTAITVNVLPLLPVTYGIWHGDDEFPPSGVILFDASARRLLSAECLIVAASNGVYALMNATRSLR